MPYTNKRFEELDVLDDFLISAIAAVPEIGEAFCRRILSVLLQREIGKIKVTAQHALPALSPAHRGIRMDVEVEEFRTGTKPPLMNLYDLEPHLQKDLDLPRHNRFYQAKIDARHLPRGERNFSKLPNLFVITILSFDPFGYDHMMYTIENHCAEVHELKYEDGLQFIYFYTEGTKGGNEKIKTMLRYLQHSTDDNACDDSTKELHGYVSQVKVMPEVRQNYMRFEEIIYYEREDAAKGTKVQDILELLEDYGEVPDSLEKQLEETEDMDLLKKYLKLAARTDSIDAFLLQSGLADSCEQ